jgi:hypothetical protein
MARSVSSRNFHSISRAEARQIEERLHSEFPDNTPMPSSSCPCKVAFEHHHHYLGFVVLFVATMYVMQNKKLNYNNGYFGPPAY